MRTFFVLAVLVAVVVVSEAGLIMTVENDIFTGSDNNYTHGTELAYGLTDLSGRSVKAGVRSWFYTPQDITVAELQPKDRPWCGVTVMFYEWTDVVSESANMTWGMEVGIQGPSAGAEWQQTEVHELIGDDIPAGWDNQLDDEPVLNGLGRRADRMAILGQEGGFEVVGTTLFGGILGTQHMRGWAGLRAEAEWNVPDVVYDGIDPKAKGRSSGFVCVFSEGRGILVVHNATICGSFFHSGQSDLVLRRDVAEAWYGVRAGWRGFAVMYALGSRTEEFQGQDGNMDWGVVSLTFGRFF
jgi:hypothetical protein